MDSIWNKENKNDEYNVSKFPENVIHTNVCIIGGGITGASTAYELQNKKVDFVLLEKDRLLSKATSKTTAKITSQHGLIYNYLINSYGLEYAKKYYEANEKAIEYIEKIVKTENIECDFKRDDSYVFTNEDKHVIDIKSEYNAVKKIGNNNVECVNSIPLPLQCKCAICFKNQASFHPIKYLNGLLKTIDNNKLFEYTTVYDIKNENNKKVVYTKKGKVICDYVVMATKYPIKDIPGFYFIKMYQETSYVIAIRPNDTKKFDGMYISDDIPKLSFRWISINQEDILLIGGNNNKTGENISLKEKYTFLEDTAKKIYPKCEVICKWNTEDTISLDKIPYIGEFSNMDKNILVATGYNKWGMTTSSIASRIITDKICGIKNEYEDAFFATRLRPIKNYKELWNMIKTSVNSLLINKLKVKDVKKVNINIGTVYKENGKLVGVYKDENGNVYKVKPTCKHLGCLLKFNELDNTWDCPCHGSRYTYTGEVIYGPSSKNLERYE